MSSYSKKVDEIFSKHTHYWVGSLIDLAANQCACGKWQISVKEKDRRIAEWKKYYESIVERQSYKDWQEMKEAYKTKNKPEMIKIRDSIASRCVRVGFDGEETDWQFTENSYLKVPTTPNPEGYPYEISS